MAFKSSDFKIIRKRLITMALSIIAAAVILITIIIVLNQRVQTLEDRNFGYHITTGEIVLNIRLDLQKIELNLRKIEALRSESGNNLSADQINKSEEIRENVALGIPMQNYILAVRYLQDLYGEDEFSNLVNNLEMGAADIQLVIEKPLDLQGYLASSLPSLAVTAQQLEFLHIEASNLLRREIGQLTNQSFLAFILGALLVTGTGLAQALRSMQSIREIYDDNSKTHNRLIDSENLLQNILDSNTDGILSLEKNGTIHTFNRAAETIFGYKSEEVLGKNILVLLPDSDRGEYPSFVDELVFDGTKPFKELNFSSIGYRRDGAKFPLELVVSEMEVSGEALFNLVVRDLSDKKLAEETLFKLQRALDESPNEIFVINAATFTFTYANQGALRSLGYTEAELYVMHPTEILMGLSSEQLRERLQPVTTMEQDELVLETIHRRKDGTDYPVEVRLSLSLWEQRPFILAIAIDITQRKQEQREKQQLEMQVQHSQKLESLGVLAGGIAHDFNNLLVSILGYSELVKNELAPESTSFQRIAAIESGAQKAAELCRQMLAYSGKGRFIIESININKLLSEISQLLQVSISKKIVLEYELDKSIQLINADTSQASQVIMNLITNASDAIGENVGEIVIRSGEIDCDRTFLDQMMLSDNLVEGRYVFIEVEDSGVGMNPEVQERLFDPFFTTKFAGRGLGLAAVLGIVRGHRGAIKVQSKVGQGTCIRIYFPVAEVETTRSISVLEGDSAWQGDGSILVVDDEESVREVAKLLLESLGFSVLTAADGQEAIRVYAAHGDHITLVLLDLTMPNLDGEQTYLKLAQLRANIRVLLTSGFNEQEVSKSITANPNVSFIRKPYLLGELQGKLQSLLGATA